MIVKINDRIRTTKVDYFNDVNLNLRYDTVASTFNFGYYFDPKEQSLIDMACIGHDHLATIEHNGQVLISGYIMNQTFVSSPGRNLARFAGYSYTGFLEDCNIPPSLYPLQNDGLTLLEIAQKLLKPFGFGIVVDSSVSSLVNSVYDTSTANESQTIKSYLAELASQKNVILSHTTKGELLFTRANTNQKAIINFDGTIPTKSMTLNYNGQGMHSHIIVQKQAGMDGGNAGEATLRNPFVPYVFRPLVKTQSSGDDNDTELAAKSVLASELKNLKLTIELDRWELNGVVIMPNNIITVKNTEVYLFNQTKWFIESVVLGGNAQTQTATLNCVLPSVYDGSVPSYIFSGINLH